MNNYTFDSTGNLVEDNTKTIYKFDKHGNIVEERVVELDGSSVEDESGLYSSTEPSWGKEDELGNAGKETPVKSKKRKKKKHIALKLLGVACGFTMICYLTFAFSNISLIANLRNTYIQTAMATLNHKWLATSFLPESVIDKAMSLKEEATEAMIGIESSWGEGNITTVYASEVIAQLVEDDELDAEDIVELPDTASTANDNKELTLEEKYAAYGLSESAQAFFEYYYQIDLDSMMEYVNTHPESVKNGWWHIDINEAGLNDSGTSIKTTNGDQVLAIDSYNGIILVRINIGMSRGVLAICKDTSKLHHYAASTLGSIGQYVGKICENNNGILAVNGSAFMDDGSSNGGQISGLGICNYTQYGTRLGSGCKRLELREDNVMYIVDSNSEVGDGTRDAVEFEPALIVDGKVIVDENCGWTGANPRTVLGQSYYGETMIAVVEGRLATSPGCSVVPLAELMVKYQCAQALNLDGGTSSMLYYKGEYINRCSNTKLSAGRTVPTAWVYKGRDSQ